MPNRADLSLVPAFAADGPGLSWRAFGAPGDLDLDLERDNRPALVTRVLAACAEGGAEEDSIWRLTLAARVGGLLAIRAATEGDGGELPLRLRCPHRDCAEALEVSLPVAELMDMAREAELEPVLRGGDTGARVHLRRPVGTDQRAWRERSFASATAAQRAILGDLVVRGDVPEADAEIAALSELLAEFDPLTCFEVSVECPACARAAEIPVDLEGVLVGWLRSAQRALLLDVHRLARRYGWSEAEILTVPARRRRRYLAIEDEGGWW